MTNVEIEKEVRLCLEKLGCEHRPEIRHKKRVLLYWHPYNIVYGVQHVRSQNLSFFYPFYMIENKYKKLIIAHECSHIADTYRRGYSDHDNEFYDLMKELGYNKYDEEYFKNKYSSFEMLGLEEKDFDRARYSKIQLYKNLKLSIV